MAKRRWIFHDSNMTLEENYDRMNKYWDQKLMEAIPENLRDKVVNISDPEYIKKKRKRKIKIKSKF